MTLRVLPASALKTDKDPVLDLDDPETNFMALLKLRGDLSGDDFFFAFPGQAWAMVPQERNYKCFRTFGFGSGRYEKMEDGVYRIYSREVLYYLDPDTGEILEEWNNPFLGNRKVEVAHIANDPVNGVFSLKGPGPLTPPYPYVSVGDHVAFQWNFFIQHPAAMNRADYPLYSSGDIDQHAELWGLMGRKSDILDDTTSAYCTMSWSRVADWLPFMEMGNAPGKMVFHSHSMKLMEGPSELPKPILDYIEKHHSEYLTAPTEWNGPQMTSSAGEFKKMIDARREAGEL